MIARLVAVLVALAIPRIAGADVASDLESAADALQRGDYESAERVAARVVLSGPSLARDDRAEGWRIYGLALFFLDRTAEADHALLEYLKLQPDAVLDPALVPPEAIRFLDDLRLEHADELAEYRPRPKRKRYWALNLAPPAGQFQNGDTTKAWTLTGLGVALAATNVITFLVLRDWCSGPGDTCDEGKTEDAERLRTVNYASGAALAVLYLYGVWDGFSGHRRISREEKAAEERRFSFDLRPTGSGAVFVLEGRF